MNANRESATKFNTIHDIHVYINALRINKNESQVIRVDDNFQTTNKVENTAYD